MAKNKNIVDISIFRVFGKIQEKLKCTLFINIIPTYIYIYIHTHTHTRRLVCDLGHKLEHILCRIFMYQQLPLFDRNLSE